MNGTNSLVVARWRGERESVGADLASERHLARRYEFCVELASRFYATWRLHGPGPLEERLHALKAAASGGAAQPDRLTSAVAPLVSAEAIDALLDELGWYARNTDPKACLWSGGAA